MSRNRKTIIILLFCIAIVWICPLIVTIIKSFSPLQMDGNSIKHGISFAQYKEILMKSPIYLHMFWNSVKITSLIVLGSILISTLGAYGFTVSKFRGKNILFFLYIVIMLLPLQVTLMPNYMIAGVLGMEDSYLAIILPAIFNPFGVFLLRQQMRTLSGECMEAARIDGAGHPQIFLYIIVPMIKSGIVALAMLLVIEYWNLIDQAIIFIKQVDKYPLSVFLSRLNAEAEGISFAAASFYMLPVLALLCYGHEYLKEGIGLMNEKGR